MPDEVPVNDDRVTLRFTAAVDIEQFIRVKVTASGTIQPANEADGSITIGTTRDEADAGEERVGVRVQNCVASSRFLAVAGAGGNIVVGEKVFTADSGRVQREPAGSSDASLIGVALEAPNSVSEVLVAITRPEPAATADLADAGGLPDGAYGDATSA